MVRLVVNAESKIYITVLNYKNVLSTEKYFYINYTHNLICKK